jgi:hypothetical protein
MSHLVRNSTGRIVILLIMLTALLAGGGMKAARAGASIRVAQAQPAKQCFDHTPHRPDNYASCRSTTPELKIYVYNNGDTSGCIFDLTIKWDDHTTPTHLPSFPGGPAGWELLASHAYAKGGVYTEGVTGSVASGNCTFTGGDLQFSYIPPETAYPQGPPITVGQILSRGADWVTNKVPYDQQDYYSSSDLNGVYREDCSGFVSMAWDLDYSLNTNDLKSVATKVAGGLKGVSPGDAILLPGHHVFLFVAWANAKHTRARVMEETGVTSPTPYTIEKALGNGSFKGYGVYRYKNMTSGAGNQAQLPGRERTGSPESSPEAGQPSWPR